MINFHITKIIKKTFANNLFKNKMQLQHFIVYNIFDKLVG